MKRILVLFAHPSPRKSEVNVPLKKSTESFEGVTIVDLYAEYPTFQIDIEKEQQRLLEHDIIVFMFPLYWYSTPSILKEWQDLVLEYGFAYGTQGRALEDKIFLCAVSAGASEEGYRSDGYYHFTIRELLRPLEQTASITRMRYIPPFALFGSRTAHEEDRVVGHVELWQKALSLLARDEINVTQSQQRETLNEYLALDLIGNNNAEGSL